MARNLTRAALVVLALAGCQKDAGKKSGPTVAQGDGIAITADEFKARLDEQSPFIRQRFTTLEKKKEFLDNLVKFEVLAAEAKRQGLDKDPEVQTMAKRMMVQKLVQKSFADDPEAAKKVPDAELQAYYDGHKDEYLRPGKVRVAQLVVKAPAAGAERAKKEAEARKLLAKIRADEKTVPGAFAAAARTSSEDEATKATGGDLGFLAKDELAARTSPAVAEAALALKDGETSDLLSTAQGFVVLKRTGWQEGLDRPFDQVKGQIASKLLRERRGKDFDEYVKKLREKAQVKVDDKALEAVAVSAAAPGKGGMGGMMGGGMGGGGMMGGGMGGAMPGARPAPAMPGAAPAAPAGPAPHP